MARKATDLLDVFRFGDDGGDDDSKRDKDRARQRASKRGSKGGGKKKASRSKRSGAGTTDEGVVLNRRQILLGSSAVVLLLVLSFVLGLSTGRSGPTDEGAAIQRSTPAKIAIRGRLPLLDPATQKSIDPGSIAGILKRDYGLKRKNLRMQRSDGRLIIDIGPFTSESQARDYLRKSGLEMLHVHMVDPFRWPEFSPW